MVQTLSASRVLLRPVVKLVAGVVGLLLLEYIILALPMVRELPSPGLSISIPQIISAIVAAAIITLLINFGIEISAACRACFPAFRSSGAIVHMAVVLATLLVAYNAYQHLALVFLGSYGWVYALAFLILTLLPLIYLIYLCYINLDKLADLAIGGFRRSPQPLHPSPGAVTQFGGRKCTKCGANLAPAVKFCRECGAPAPQLDQEPLPEQRQCVKCGATLNSGVAFCTECGTPIPAVSQPPKADCDERRAMADFFGKLREQIDAGLTKVTTKSRTTLETVRLRGQIHRIAKEREEALARLGAQVYQEMSRDGQLNQEILQQEVQRIQGMDRSIEELQKEINRLEEADAATPWSTVEGKEKPIASCTCGAPITEGTKFCGNCGANTQEIIAKAKEEQAVKVEATKKADGASCPRCGAEVSAAARFCRSCGTTLEKQQKAEAPSQNKSSCPHCGNEVSPTARFCKSCGKSMVSETSPAQTEAGGQTIALDEARQQVGTSLQDSAEQKET